MMYICLDGAFLKDFVASLLAGFFIREGKPTSCFRKVRMHSRGYVTYTHFFSYVVRWTNSKLRTHLLNLRDL
jgi:hypothetical protein